jgi:hypothetical protein
MTHGINATQILKPTPSGGNQIMKLFIHTSILSVVFAGVLAGAVTIKPTAPVTGTHSQAISYAMPIPTCPTGTGCPLR